MYEYCGLLEKIIRIEGCDELRKFGENVNR